MSNDRTERRLAAILAADVVGYSRLMGMDEEGTLARLKTLRRDLVDPAISLHRGRIVKTMGDGLLVEFASAVDAARCAAEVQRDMARQNAEVAPDGRIDFRIGLHIGDIIIDDADIFGDGVNIAARLEGIAEPGGICLSDDAQRQVRAKIDLGFEDMGLQDLKNIAEPIRAWRVRLDGVKSALTPSIKAPLALPDKPSIAVLPFQNMSGDPEQEYFADGMVEDIVTALSRFKSLFVIARNSSFTYKGKAVDIKQVGRELGVRYVLEGSVRKSGTRLRISGQLIEVATGAHVWADKFDRELNDIFVLQDEITEKVAAIIEPNITRAEIERAALQRPGNLTAYDLYLRALPQYYTMSEEGFAQAILLCSRALEIDPRYSAAVRLLADMHGLKPAQGWSKDVKSDYADAMRFGRRALEIDGADPDTLAMFGRGLAAFSNDYDTAKGMVDRAVALNPNSARAWSERGWTYRYMKKADEALVSFERAVRLSPVDPKIYDTLTGVASTLIIMRRDDEAVENSRRALALNSRFTSAYRCLAAALAHLNREAEAKEAASALLEIEPSFRISAWANYGGQWQGERFLEGLRLAGLPA
ncbi:adenylate cyclase [Bradyrhizobium sp. USDA 4449]